MSNPGALGGLNGPDNFDDDFGDFEAVPPDDGTLRLAAEAPRLDGADSGPADSSRQTLNGVGAPAVSLGDACSCSKASQGDSTSQDSGLCTCNRWSPTNVLKCNGMRGVETESGPSLTAAKREDSFGDFHQAENETACDETSLPAWKEEEEDDGFTDFAEAKFADFSAAFEEEKEEEAEWGAFAAVEREETNAAPGLEPCDLKTLLHEAFPDAAPVARRGSSEDTGVRSLENHELHERLWEGLRDLDRAASLRQQWSNSRACQHLLRSLNIDSRNILRNPAVPLFATQLGLLEPQRGDSAAPERPPSPPDCQESIPPAQFDWRSSGLVNPLEQPSSSSLLDLEFLSGLGSSTMHRMSSLEEEFLGDEPVRAAPDSPKLPPQLRQLLESGTSMQDTSGRPPELSAEAGRLLDRLPDLSFMRATVLMFPVRL